MSSWEERFRQALALELPYPDRAERDMPERFRSGLKPAAVLVLVAQHEGHFSILFTQRTENVDTHKGQMAFPGGKVEPGEAMVEAALRETEEEVGVPSSQIHVIGELPSLLTVTGFKIAPFVGFLDRPLEEIALKPSPGEIAKALWVSSEVLWHPDTYRRETIEVGQVHYPIHVYQVGEHRIWGATGSMTKNLLDRLQSLG